MTQRGRKLFFDSLRIAICVAALWYVIRGVTLHDCVSLRSGGVAEGMVQSDGDPLILTGSDGVATAIAHNTIAANPDGSLRVSYGLLGAWKRSDKRLLLLAVVLYFPIVLPLAQRFRILLRAQGIDLSFRESVRLTFAGNFLNFTTPLGSNAGDVFKAYFASLHTSRKTEAVTTVVLDRAIGLGTLVAVAAAITVLAPTTSRLAELRPYMLFLLAAGVVGAGLYLSPLARFIPVPQGLRRLAVAQQIARMDQAVRILARSRWTLVAAVLLTVGLQLLALSSYFVAAIALSMKATAALIPEYFAYFYMGAMIQALPGPPQGLGTVELAYRHFFSAYGSASQIICLAFAIRLIALIASLPGLIVTLTGSYRPGMALPGNFPSANPQLESPDARRDLIGASKST
jgi:hypothetical protein